MSASASAARLQGDDYQHLFAWYHAMRLLLPGEDVTRVEVESADAGNVDDVVIRRSMAADEYVQVKYSVDASSPISSDWFTTPGRPNGKSPLQRFFLSWQQLKAKGLAPELTLFTNRVLDPGDPILRLRTGTRATLGQRLSGEKPRSAAGKQLQRWMTHVGASRVDLLEVLTHLGLKTDQGAWSGLVEAASDRMGFLGLRTGEVEVEAGVTAVRAWVKRGLRVIDSDELQREIEHRGLRGDSRYTTLLVEAIDHAQWPDAAQVRLDWVDLFSGSEPRARRQLSDPANWSARLRPDMIEAARRLKAAGNDRVVVRGYMRLALWFLCGVELPDTRGHHVACNQRGQMWTSEAVPVAFPLAEAITDLKLGDDIAVGLSTTNSVAGDVVAYCKRSAIPVSLYVDVSPSAGIGHHSIPDGAAATSWALAVRDAVRGIVRSAQARRVHLFMSCPAGGALLLGHIWNRVGTTLVYEDLSPGYAPTFEIPG